ncbi:MAG: cytochrome c biogenesis protein CcdA [bacterium]
MSKIAFSLLLANLTFFTNAPAQFEKPDIITVETFLSVDKIRPGDEFKIGLSAKIDGEWHINSNKPTEEFLIPTLVAFDTSVGLVFNEIHYPAGELKKFEFSETPLSVYQKQITIWANVTASKTLKTGPVNFTGKFSYQACNDVSCLAPASVAFAMTASVVEAGSAITPKNTEKFSAKEPELGLLQGERESGDDKINQLISGKGLTITLFFIFLGGLALNLTPCVYPLIPITISYFVGQASDRLSKSFLMALIYVLGMSITYSVMGVVAAMTGGLLGASLQNPGVLIAISTIFLIFAAGMFGAFEIRIPIFLTNLAGSSKQGIGGSLFMGLTVGIVAAPCIGPFVLSLLTYVAAQGDPFLGFLMFFILSMGLGLPFLILGTFSGLVKNLPRSGEWMGWVKKVFGVVMIAVAGYFVSTLIPDIAYIVLLTAVALIGGFMIGFLDKSQASFSWFKPLKIVVGVLMILFGLWTSVSAWNEAKKAHISWQAYDDALVVQALAARQPVLIDFYADWCIPCKQIDKTLFSQSAVIAKSGSFLSLKADLTKNNLGVTSLRKKYQVHGVPTVILIDIEGNEFRRFTDELVDFSTEEFVEIMEGAQGSGRD